jgi:hypothetical protein
METAQARSTRWHPVPFWGIGWSVGAIAFLAALAVFAKERAWWVSFLLLPTAGAAAFGLPTYVGARRTAARAPLMQAFVWVAGFTIAGAFVMNDLSDRHRLAKPGELNINTDESMRERQRSFARWGRPPEVVASLFLSVGVVISFSVVSGIVSANIGTDAGTPQRAVASTLFGIAAAFGIIIGLWVGAVTTSLLLPAAGFAGGCTAGAIIERARTKLLSRDEPPAST